MYQIFLILGQRMRGVVTKLFDPSTTSADWLWLELEFTTLGRGFARAFPFQPTQVTTMTGAECRSVSHLSWRRAMLTVSIG